MGSQSKFKDFIAFLSSVRGDLANITAPPYFLAPQSVTEIGTCWNQRPAIFVAPSLEADPQKRMLLVLKWFLVALRAQFYVGGDVDASIKKPLNAFLGELFLASWKDEEGLESSIVTEQVRSVVCMPLLSSQHEHPILKTLRRMRADQIVTRSSHHPPITALHMWSDEHGIRATGYSRIEMTFAGSINIRQTGHAQLHIDKYDEDYLLPLPDVKVKGFFSGALYPELSGVYHIVSSRGLISEVSFSGKGIFGGGVRNAFDATVYRKNGEEKTKIYEVKGSWSDKFTFFDATSGDEIETWDTSALTSPLKMAPLLEQDPWETRRAWQHVLAPLKKGDLSTTIAEKSKLEEAQRAMRKKEKAGLQEVFTPLFFVPQHNGDPLFESLANGTGWQLQSDRTKGVWKFDSQKARAVTKPYHGDLTPFG